MSRIRLTVFAVSLSVGSLAFADTVSFSGPNTDLGKTYTFTLDGVAIVASGFVGTTASDLYGKNNGGDESGLGLNGDPSGDHEIWYKSANQDFVQLDVTNLLKAGFTNLQFEMGSTTQGEQWSVSGCNVSGVLCNSGTVSGKGEGSFTAVPVNLNLTKGFVYLDFYSSKGGKKGGNVLLSALSATPDPPAAIPEPRYGLLLVGGLFAAVVVLKDRNTDRA